MTPEKPRCARHAFTLIELLTVMAVIAVLLAVSVPILNTGFTSPALTGASSAVASGLEQARARSLALGTYTGLFVMSNPRQSDAFLKFALFDIAELNDTGLYEVLDVPERLTEWEALPQGVVFATGVGTPATILDLSPTTENMGVRVEGEAPDIGLFSIRTDEGVETMRLHGIVFGPNGAVAAPQQAGGRLDIGVCEGFTVEGGGGYTLQLPPEENRKFKVVRVGRLSGSIRVIDQENYD